MGFEIPNLIQQEFPNPFMEAQYQPKLVTSSLAVFADPPNEKVDPLLLLLTSFISYLSPLCVFSGNQIRI
jgi:hypothetical protein